jgi:LCP family protein required for cell wall assembly
MFRGRSAGSAPLWGYAGKVGYLACCVTSAVILVVGGFAHKWVTDVNDVGSSHVITGNQPSVGEMNILLMGLESRTYWNGQILPENILNAMHACSQQGVENGCGGNDTNTLILIHIPAGGGKAVGFSIPRDDFVNYPQPYDGQSGGKIDQAYGLAMAAEEDKLLNADGGKLTNQIAFQGNEAGRAATIATVEQVTGVQINHFAEVNLVGFYELAQVFGGVDVCLNHPVAYDSYSGFYAHHAGLQHLNAAMALAFVRQRHGLTNGDLDRTHRQQAVVDSVIHQLKTEGVLSDIPKLNQLLDAAKQWVVTDSDWKLMDFATQMQSLESGNTSFQTLPITGYATIDGQDDNTINLQYIQQLVKDTFAAADNPPAPKKETAKHSATPPPPKATPTTTTVDVYNGGNTPGLASEVLTALQNVGYQQGQVGNTTALTTTQVLYGTGAQGSADNIASDFKVTAQASGKVAAGTVEVMLGADATAVPAIGTPNAPASSAPPATPEDSNGDSGGTVHAIDGIPCVD